MSASFPDSLFNNVGVRWTIGNATPRGFEALSLSVWGAWQIFGPAAEYAICVNNLSCAEAQRRTGSVPPGVQWIATGPERLPVFLRPYVGDNWSEGTSWKFAPLQVFPERYELALDNDCILWDLPTAIAEWLRAGHGRCLLAGDLSRCAGRFSELCGPEPRNSGIRGLPPGFDFASALESVLSAHPVRLVSEQDEQGLQTAALEAFGAPLVVSAEQVTICSPFPRHVPHLGSHGAHFVGVNAPELPWSYVGRPATDWIAEHWDRHREELHRRVYTHEPSWA